MKININVKRKFKINGKEYNSIEEMPADIRKVFEKAGVSQSKPGYPISPELMQTKIIFNDKEYESIEAMPQEIRQLYEKVLEAAAAEAAPSDIDLIGISSDLLKGRKAPGTVYSGDVLQGPKIEPSFSLKKVIMAVALVALFFVLYYLFHSK